MARTLSLVATEAGAGRIALAALAALTLARLAVAALAPLSPDEAYYWVWSRDLQPGYLDAPPMVALWIRAGTTIAGQGALGVRLLGPLSGALGSWLLYRAAEDLLPGRRAGLTAVALLNATLLFGAGAVIMTPDTPLLFFWVCALWAAAGFLREGSGRWLVAAGLFAGLALASKYTAVFLGLGLGLWLLLTPGLRRWLARPAPWVGLSLGILAVLPMVVWNGAHGWASFAKQGGRLGEFSAGRAGRFLIELVVGQIGLATPLVFLLCVAGVVLAVRMAWRRRDPAWTLLALLTVPPAALFMQHALGDRVQANWPAILYPAACIAAAGLDGPLWRRLRAPAVALGLAITSVVYLQAAAAPFPVPVRMDPTARQLAGWPGLAAEVEALRTRASASFVAADDYGPAAELARALPAGVAVIGVEPRWALFSLPKPALAGRVGILVRSERRGPDLDRAPWASVEAIGEAARRRGGEVVETFRVYRVVGGSDEPVAAVLPRP